MLEEAEKKQSKLQAIIESIKNTIFSTIIELLKEKKAGIYKLRKNIGKWYASLLMLIMFVQLIGFLFDPDVGLPFTYV